MNSQSPEELQKKIQDLEAQLAQTTEKLQTSGIELEANEALLKLAMEDMRRIYEDLMRSQTQLMQSDKLATIGLLTAGIVHEINNPLAALRLAVSLLQGFVENLKKNDSVRAEEASQYLQQAQTCVESMVRIVGDIRMFSRSDKGVLHEEDLNQIIESVLGIVRFSVKHKVTIRKELGQIPKIRCNAQQLSQVFLNLIVNASQAVGDHTGIITLRTFEQGDTVVAAISDTGCGMTDEVRSRIFEPFFTTKGAEQGTGLGLSITFDILKKHSAQIDVESALGQGTTFTLRFPRA